MTLKFRSATIEDYAEPLAKFIERNGTDRLDYGGDYLPRMLVAMADFRLCNDLGACSRMIIVPPRVSFLGGDLGHCRLLFSDGGFLADYPQSLPVWDAWAFRNLGLAEWIDAQKVKMERAEREFAERQGKLMKSRFDRSDLAQYLYNDGHL